MHIVCRVISPRIFLAPLSARWINNWPAVGAIHNGGACGTDAGCIHTHTHTRLSCFILIRQRARFLSFSRPRVYIYARTVRPGGNREKFTSVGNIESHGRHYATRWCKTSADWTLDAQRWSRDTSYAESTRDREREGERAAFYGFWFFLWRSLAPSVRSAPLADIFLSSVRTHFCSFGIKKKMLKKWKSIHFTAFPRARVRPPTRSLLFPFHDASFVTTRRWKSAEICERVEITVISFLCYIFVLFNTFLTGLRVLFYAFYTFTRIAENLRCSFGERSKLSLCFYSWLINWKK